LWQLLSKRENQAPQGRRSSAAGNPKVSIVLDLTDIGRNTVRLEATAKQVGDQPAADKNAAYLATYT
jgi:hypothetical protein